MEVDGKAGDENVPALALKILSQVSSLPNGGSSRRTVSTLTCWICDNTKLPISRPSTSRSLELSSCIEEASMIFPGKYVVTRYAGSGENSTTLGIAADNGPLCSKISRAAASTARLAMFL